MELAFLKPYLPDFILNARKRFLKKRLQEKLLRDIERRNQEKRLSAAEFNRLLKEVGVQSGDCGGGHGGIGSSNPVEGGPPAILKTLEEAGGPAGNLIFPAFPDWWK